MSRSKSNKGKGEEAKAKRDRQLLRQTRFVQFFLIHGNAARAAREAGYSAKAAKETGARLLTFANIQQQVREGEQARQARVQFEQDYVLKRLQRIADANLHDIVEIKDGVPVLRENLGREELYGVEAVTCVETSSGRIIPRVKLKSSEGALQTIAKIQGLLDGGDNPESDDALNDAIRDLDAEEAKG